MTPRQLLASRLLAVSATLLPFSCGGSEEPSGTGQIGSAGAAQSGASGSGSGTTGAGGTGQGGAGNAGAGGGLGGAGQGGAGNGGAAGSVGPGGPGGCNPPPPPTAVVQGCYAPVELVPGVAAFCRGEKGLTKISCKDGSFSVAQGWPASPPCDPAGYERNCPQGVTSGQISPWPQMDPCGAGEAGAGGAAGAGSAGAAGEAGAAGSPLPVETACDVPLSAGMPEAWAITQFFACVGHPFQSPSFQSPGIPGGGLATPIKSSEMSQKTEGGKLSCCFDVTFQGQGYVCGRPLEIHEQWRLAPLVRGFW